MVHDTPFQIKAAPPAKDWGLLAVPREDGSDTHLLLQYASRCGLALTPPPAEGEPTCFDGRVALRRLEENGDFGKGFGPAHPDHPNIATAEEILLHCWPEIHTQFGALINAFYPALCLSVKDDGKQQLSNSHQPPGTFGAFWATVYDPLLLAQAFVHELAHNKLFALGQHIETTNVLFENSADERFDSPIRLDIPRPISALFHGVYAFTHVLSLDRRILGSLPETLQEKALFCLHHNTLRMKKGIAILERCARPSQQGRPFLNAFLQWARTEVEMSTALYRANIVKSAKPLVLFGAEGSGKSDLAKCVAAATGLPLIHPEKIRWSVWAGSQVMSRKLYATFGSREMIRDLFAEGGISKVELLKTWMKNGAFSPEEMDFLKVELACFVLNRYPDAVIDYPAELCILESKALLEHFQLNLQEAAAISVYVRPLTDLNRAATLLENRAGETIDHPSTERVKMIRKSLEHPAFRTLTQHLVDSEQDPETACADLIGLMEEYRTKTW